MIKNYAVIEVATGEVTNTIVKDSMDQGWQPEVGSILLEIVPSQNYTTASVTNGEKSVTVSGATLITLGIKVGQGCILGDSDTLYKIASITGETTFTIDINYDGATVTSDGRCFIRSISIGDVIVV